MQFFGPQKAYHSHTLHFIFEGHVTTPRPLTQNFIPMPLPANMNEAHEKHLPSFWTPAYSVMHWLHEALLTGGSFTLIYRSMCCS